MTSKAGRQGQILRGQKYPPDYITSYYRDAQESISLFIADSMEDIRILENRIKILEQQNTQNIYETRRVTGNIEAIEGFMKMIDEIDLKNAVPKLGGEAQPQKLKIYGVEVSVRPEIILNAEGARGKQLIGGVKLHFPKTNPLNEEAGGYISTALQMYLDSFLQSTGVPSAKHCLTIDIASGKVYEGVTAITQRKKDVEAACEQIFNLWPSIKQ